ncbi:cyclase family protein [Nocardioides carbamazepini]|jgi:kynurenine formamidase|uniref:cyclase family protein n=1 Tax=Nocardioides carbamazepini TaxID=2854259 RepID=UPI002149A2CC|nr:cyclase family protein [Nocardioides carbamazepini]MCR1783419.1 cyclase family protein [Nocardioides carbamazepini]
MTTIVDLSRTLDPAYRDMVPPAYEPLAAVLAPKIHYLAPGGEGLQRTMDIFGCPAEHLPNGEGWGEDWLTEMNTHCGTHVDAPLHSGSLIEGKPARTISDIDLSELYRPGMVLDVRPWAAPGEAISIEALEQAISATGREVRQGDALLLRTGQERYTPADPEFFNYPGMNGDGTRYLTGLGATILGTDAMAWDRPFPVMKAAYEATGDPKELWDGHFAIADKEAFIIQQLDNLQALPLTGFHVGFFPIKLPKTSASPCRVVGFLDN